MPEAYGNVALTLGLLLLAALLAGMLAERFRLPKVTAYLLVGLLLGPYTVESLPAGVFAWLPRQFFAITTISKDDLVFLDPVAKFAMALVLFNMGCSFTLRSLRSHLPRMLRLSAGELLLTFSLVSIGLVMLGEPWIAAILFGVLALATAPATTVLVLKENRSEGPITNNANSLVALNNVASIVIFEVLLVIVLAVNKELGASVLSSLGQLTVGLAIAIAIGFLAGLTITAGCAIMPRSRWLIALIAITSTLMGLCQHWHVPYLLTFLVMGATVANTSDRTRDIVGHLDSLTGLLCVVFFVIHGTELDVRALLAAGVIGFAYIVLRAAGKYFGIYLASVAQDGPILRRWLGATLMSQAGAAIALSEIAAERSPELGEHLMDIILGTVVVFEIAGPILIRQAVIRGGEVPLGTAILHHETRVGDQWRSIWRRLLALAGRTSQANQLLKRAKVGEIMRRARAVPASAPFARVVEFLENSHDDVLPVVDQAGQFVGIISYHELEDAHFDPGLGPLVRAEDLAMTSYPVLHPDQTAAEAWHEFQHSSAICLPVVARQHPRDFLGIVRRQDVESPSCPTPSSEAG